MFAVSFIFDSALCFVWFFMIVIVIIVLEFITGNFKHNPHIQSSIKSMPSALGLVLQQEIKVYMQLKVNTKSKKKIKEK